MKYYLILLSAVGLQATAFSQPEAETLQSTLTDVVVYTKGAQLKREGKCVLPAGASAWVVKGLSPDLDPKSIQVSLAGDATILSVEHRLEFLDTKQQESTLSTLTTDLQIVHDSLAIHTARREVLAELKSVLTENKVLYNKDNAHTIANLEAALALYNTELQKIKNEELAITVSDRLLKKREVLLQSQIAESQNSNERPESQILIHLSSQIGTSASLVITYYTPSAGWYPAYDVRVSNISNPLQVTYKANVYQNSGEDWNDVLLTFTNALAYESGTTPTLVPWKLTYGRLTTFLRQQLQPGEISGIVTNDQGEPLIGAQVSIPGTTLGTVTDYQGRYRLLVPYNASSATISYVGFETCTVAVTSAPRTTVLRAGVALDEIVVRGGQNYYIDGVRVSGISVSSGAADRAANIPLPVSINESVTSVEFVVDRPMTIVANGKTRTIDLQQVEIDAEFHYLAIPKLQKSAYLNALILSPDRYALLDGEANIYFENTFVGRSLIDTRAFSDTLAISLGVDKNVLVDRAKVTEANTRRFLASNVTDRREFEISLKNNKSSTVRMTILDQVPLAIVNAIEIKPEIPDNATLDPETGEVTWEVTIPQQQTFHTRIAYAVRYPKSETVYLE